MGFPRSVIGFQRDLAGSGRAARLRPNRGSRRRGTSSLDNPSLQRGFDASLPPIDNSDVDVLAARGLVAMRGKHVFPSRMAAAASALIGYVAYAAAKPASLTASTPFT